MKHARERPSPCSAHVAAEKGGARPHRGVEYHYYADYTPSSTPIGAGAADNAGLEHKITACTTVTDTPAPTRFRMFHEPHD